MCMWEPSDVLRLKRFQDGKRETKLKIKITILDNDLEQQNNTNWYILKLQ